MLPRNPSLVSTLALVALLLGSGVAASKTSDREQALVARADRSEYSDALQRQTLIGNVVVEQGSLKIKADRIVVFLKQGALERFEASGAPATFEQLDDNDNLVRGVASNVDYVASSGELTLTGNAQLENPTQSLSAETIHYNVSSHAATAQGNDGESVNIVIQPSNPQQ